MNPYETPQAESQTSTSKVFDDSRYAVVGRVVVLWEKLRLLYILILAVVSIAAMLLSGPFGGGVHLFISDVILGIVVANAAYCLGPLIDGYLSWFGVRSNVVTTVLFVAGTAIASSLAFVSISPWTSAFDK